VTVFDLSAEFRQKLAWARASLECAERRWHKSVEQCAQEGMEVPREDARRMLENVSMAKARMAMLQREAEEVLHKEPSNAQQP
jgi:hypothetical protein